MGPVEIAGLVLIVLALFFWIGCVMYAGFHRSESARHRRVQSQPRPAPEQAPRREVPLQAGAPAEDTGGWVRAKDSAPSSSRPSVPLSHP
jgi:hypothetical protein